jgi:hypothetical protein
LTTNVFLWPEKPTSEGWWKFILHEPHDAITDKDSKYARIHAKPSLPGQVHISGREGRTNDAANDDAANCALTSLLAAQNWVLGEGVSRSDIELCQRFFRYPSFTAKFLVRFFDFMDSRLFFDLLISLDLLDPRKNLNGFHLGALFKLAEPKLSTLVYRCPGESGWFGNGSFRPHRKKKVIAGFASLNVSSEAIWISKAELSFDVK